MQARWGDDEALLEDLREALRPLPSPPPDVVAAAKSLYTWRTVDAELAALVYDSDLDDALLTRLRSDAAGGRTLVYEVPGLSVELDVSGGGLVGQVLPPQPLDVEVQVPSGTGSRVEVDELGRFLVAPVPAGPVRLRCHTAEGLHFTTPWTRF